MGNDAPLFETHCTNEKMIARNTPVQGFLIDALPKGGPNGLKGLQWLIENYDIGKTSFCDKAVRKLYLRAKKHSFFAILMWISMSSILLMMAMNKTSISKWTIPVCFLIFMISFVASILTNPKGLTIEMIDPVFSSIIEELNKTWGTKNKAAKWHDPYKVQKAAERAVLEPFQLLLILEKELKEMNSEDYKFPDRELEVNNQRRKVHGIINLLRSNNVVDRDFRSWHQEILEIMRRNKEPGHDDPDYVPGPSGL